MVMETYMGKPGNNMPQKKSKEAPSTLLNPYKCRVGITETPRLKVKCLRPPNSRHDTLRYSSMA